MKYLKKKKIIQIFFIFYVLILIATPINIISTSFALRSYDLVDKEKPYPSDAFITTLNGKKYLAEYITREKVEEMKKQSELKVSNKNYNQIIDGHGTGYTPPTTEELEKLIGKVSLIDIIPESGFQNYRASADISAEIYFPVVGDQASQGSCTSWANVYYAYGYMEAKDYGWPASSGNPDYLLSPAWSYNKLVDTDAGSMPLETAELIKELGVATLSTMPYDDSDIISWGDEPAWREAPYHRPLDYTLIDYIGPSTIDTIKSLLDSGIPVTFGIDALQFYTGGFNDNYIISSAEYDDSGSLNHAQCIVGYDDAVTDDEDMGAFRIVNSWGDFWGDSGYYWLTYDAFSEFADASSQFILFYTDIIDYNPSLIATWEFSAAPTRMDDIITLGVGPHDSPLETITFHYGSDTSNIFPEFMALDISAFQAYYNADNDVLFFLEVGPSIMTGTISSFLIERYAGGILQEITQESIDVPKDTPGYVRSTFMIFDHELKVTLEIPDNPAIADTYIINATVSNLGNNPEINVELYLYLDNIIINSTTVSTLPIGTSKTINYSWTPLEYREYNFTAFAPPVAGEFDLANNFIVEFALVGMIVFFDDFESGLSQWDSITGLWHLTGDTSAWPDPYHSPTHSMWFGDEATGDYDTGYHETGDLISTPFSLDGVGLCKAGLEFFHWREGEGGGWDESFVYISVDGINWENLYTTDRNIAPWEKVSLDLSSYAGNSYVQLKFNFDTYDEEYNDYRGWLVDDVQISAYFLTHDLRVTMEIPDSPEIYNTYIINATVTNSGQNDESNIDLFLYLESVLVNATTISTLIVGESKTINYTWTPTEYKDFYNFTAKSSPLSSEIYLENNIVTELLPLVVVHLFDGMYINYTFSNSDAVIHDDMFFYNFYLGDLFYGMWYISGSPDAVWKVDTKTRIMTEGTPFGDGTHTPIWIFTHVSLGDEVLIATDGLGDHLYNVTDEQTYDLPNFDTIDVWVLEDITIPGSFAWYEKTTGILIKGKFYVGSWWFALDCYNTNVDFPYPPDTFALSSTAGDPHDDDGKFDLTWYKSDWASSYTVYESSSYITEITGDLTPLIEGTTNLEFSCSGYDNGTYFFIVQAFNTYGEILSNCIEVVVEIPSEEDGDGNGDGDDDGDGDGGGGGGIPGYSLFILITFIAVVSIIILKKQYTHMRDM